MLIKIFLVLALIILAVCLFFAYLSMTTKVPDLGLLEGRLNPCPDKPDCVSGEPGSATSHRVEPFHFEGAPDLAWQTLKQVIVAQGGQITEEQTGYLRAEFRHDVLTCPSQRRGL